MAQYIELWRCNKCRGVWLPEERTMAKAEGYVEMQFACPRCLNLMLIRRRAELLSDDAPGGEPQ